MSTRALAPTMWRPCGRLTNAEREIVEEYFGLLLRGELRNYGFSRQTKRPYSHSSFIAVAKSELDAIQEAAVLGPGWEVNPVDHAPGELGCFRVIGIGPAIDLFGPDGKRWEGPILPRRDTCPECGQDDLHWIYTGHPPDVEYGECDRCAPRVQVAWRPLARRRAPADVQGDLFAEVPA